MPAVPLASPSSIVNAKISSVYRTFDDANQLLVSTDTELGTTSFYYDGNGNLDQILPPGINPGEAGEQLYTFDQRNLLTQYQVGAGGSVYDTVAEYIYDGNGNRLQQIDSSGETTVTTTYTNDNAGMSQVLPCCGKVFLIGWGRRPRRTPFLACLGLASCSSFAHLPRLLLLSTGSLPSPRPTIVFCRPLTMPWKISAPYTTMTMQATRLPPPTP